MPIQGTPLLSIWLQLLERHGITDVLVNLHSHPGQVERFLTTAQTRLRVHTAYEPSLLGSAGTVLTNRAFVAGEAAFLIAYADNLTNVDLEKLVRFHGGRDEALTLGVVPTDKPREKGTVILGGRGQVLEFEEKAPEPRSTLANAGIYVTGPALFDYMPANAPQDRVLDFGHHILPAMVPNVAAFPLNDFLMDIGTPEDYRRAQEVWPGLDPGQVS